MVQPPQPPADQLDWAPLLGWTNTLAADGFDPGQFEVGRQLEPDVFTLPSAVRSDETLAFVKCLDDQQVVAGFDWSGWLAEGGREIVEDPDRLATATLEECRMLLAAHARADRFIDGHLLDVLMSGHVAAILRRIEELTDGLP